jgi:hypothetical protein
MRNNGVEIYGKKICKGKKEEMRKNERNRK